MTMSGRTPAELRTLLMASLSPAARDAVERIVAARGGRGVYAVGGVVRDLLLGRRLVDVDIATEDDAIDLVRRALPDARITTHVRFRTASVLVDGTRIDVATSRTETYARAGGLPHVTPAPIVDDLRRRDFSVNAIALRLSGAAELVDPCAGVQDLDARLIRVLHDGSFLDDPTRIYRALRYAARLGFTLEAHTSALLRDGVNGIATVGGERLRRELELTLGEESAGQALEACQATGVLRATHGALHWNRSRSEAYAHAPGGLPRAPYGFALLATGASLDDAVALCERLRLKRDEAAAVRAIATMATLADVLRRPEAKPSGVAGVLDGYPAAAVAAFAACAPDEIARQLSLRYLEEWRHVRPMLSGRDLQEMGVPAGPQVQRGLQLIRAARLDGWATGRGDEQALALRFAKSIRDSSATSAGVEPRSDGE